MKVYNFRLDNHEWTNCTKYIRIYKIFFSIRLSEKSLSFTDTSFITTYLYRNMEHNPSNVVMFVLIELLRYV